MDKKNTNPPAPLLNVFLRSKNMFLVIAMFIAFYTYLDLDLAIIFSRLNLRQTSIFLNWLTYLGDGIIILPFLFGGFMFRYFQKNMIWERRFWFISQCIIFSSLICWILKITFGRARPKMWFNVHEYGFYWFNLKGSYWSFPSGHATTVFSIVFGLIVLFPRYRFLLMVLGTLVALTRVLLNYHYFSDVLVGGYLAGLEVSLLIYLLRKKNRLSEIF